MQEESNRAFRQLTNNSTGSITDSYEYDAFGNHWTVSGTTPNEMLYRGEQWDPDLGLLSAKTSPACDLVENARVREPVPNPFFPEIGRVIAAGAAVQCTA